MTDNSRAETVEDLRYCKSCGNNTPAVSYGVLTFDSGKMTKWPLCEGHEPLAMIAGWYPITRISPTKGNQDD